MPDRSFLAWPFFDDAHRTLAAKLGEWAKREIKRTGARTKNSTSMR